MTKMSPPPLLPPRLDGETPQLPASTRRVVVVGANGAGKSRFARRMLAAREGSPDADFDVSALRALYTPGADSWITRRYRRLTRNSILRPELPTEFESLVAMMLEEETRDLYAAKYAPSLLPEGPSALERLVGFWEELFPDNRMLLNSGRLLVSPREGDYAAYDSARLSDGEKAVIYYLGCALICDPSTPLFVDNPDMFLNRAITSRVWDIFESLRRAVTVYVTHSLDFASTRTGMADTAVIWIKSCNDDASAWDYELLPAGAEISEDVFNALMGARKPVLFIEGDGLRSIDARFYPMVFSEYSVKSLGSCTRVIEATRTFNSLGALHSLAATGIVDRDRREDREVAYLRRHNIMVPEVAEIENLMMVEDIIRAVAEFHGRPADRAFGRVRRALINLFRANIEQQAMLHTRHHVKMTAAYTLDRRFGSIAEMERHLAGLVGDINPREFYRATVESFRRLADAGDYAGILKVYNYKSMLTETNVAALTGCSGNDRRSYVNAVIGIMRSGAPQALRIADAVRRTFGLPEKPQ